jgi:nucleoside-diphosphate-sugar epimerase
MRVLVVGGEGFIGEALVSRVLKHGVAGRAAAALTILDQRILKRREDARLRHVEGDISDVEVIRAALGEGVDVVFHLASIPGGAAEQNFELGMRVNLHATLGLLEVLRQSATQPRLVFASSIGIYGVPLPDVIDENTIPLPTLSYGAQKLVGEYLVADYGRRGFVDGRSVRIPGIVARPPAKGMLSLFLSDLIRELSAGRSFLCPVAAEGMSWWMSRPCIVDNLLHAVALTPEQVRLKRTWLIPVQHVSVGAVVAAIARLHGREVLERVRYEPNAQLQAQFANYPPLLCPASEAAGFRHDGSIETLVQRALEPV